MAKREGRLVPLDELARRSRHGKYARPLVGRRRRREGRQRWGVPFPGV